MENFRLGFEPPRPRLCLWALNVLALGYVWVGAAILYPVLGIAGAIAIWLCGGILVTLLDYRVANAITEAQNDDHQAL